MIPAVGSLGSDQRQVPEQLSIHGHDADIEPVYEPDLALASTRRPNAEVGTLVR